MLGELCTYLDRNYLPQGLALISSLPSAGVDRLWVLALDEFTIDVLRAIQSPYVQIVTLDDLLAYDPQLREAKSNRSLLEFYYSCTPRIVQYVFDRDDVESGEGVTYIDADMYFFSSAANLFDEVFGAEVILIEHDSGDEDAELERGRYNVCLVHFASTSGARECLAWWACSTLKSTKLGEGVWGDQKYLDEFPARFEKVAVLRAPAATLAPWNIWRRRLSQGPKGSVVADGETVVVYHFARLLFLSPHTVIPIRRNWLSREALDLLYRPYIRSLRSAYRDICRINPTYRVGYTRRNLRGLMLGLAAGRMFYEGRFGLRRIGIWIPSSAAEMKARRFASDISRETAAVGPAE